MGAAKFSTVSLKRKSGSGERRWNTTVPAASSVSIPRESVQLRLEQWSAPTIPAK